MIAFWILATLTYNGTLAERPYVSTPAFKTQESCQKAKEKAISAVDSKSYNMIRGWACLPVMKGDG